MMVLGVDQDAAAADRQADDTDDSSQLQMEKWLAGHPEHNTERDECCPDFSCCQPHLLAPLN